MPAQAGIQSPHAPRLLDSRSSIKYGTSFTGMTRGHKDLAVLTYEMDISPLTFWERSTDHAATHGTKVDLPLPECCASASPAWKRGILLPLLGLSAACSVLLCSRLRRWPRQVGDSNSIFCSTRVDFVRAMHGSSRCASSTEGLVSWPCGPQYPIAASQATQLVNEPLDMQGKARLDNHVPSSDNTQE